MLTSQRNFSARLCIKALTRHLAQRCLVFVLLCTVASIAAGGIPRAANSLLLNDSNIRYEINSARQGSGFFTCPEGLVSASGVDLANLKSHSHITTTLPDFKKNNSYCFFINFRNDTDQTNWMIHFSNFFIDQVKFVLINGSEPYANNRYFSTGLNDENINVLGRSFSLRLEQNKSYFLAIELIADGLVAPPYIGLMTERSYQDWSTGMDTIYNLSVGIILGLILVALLCSVILKDITFFWFGTSSLLLIFFFAIRSYIGFHFVYAAEGLPSWIWLWASTTMVSMLLFASSFLLPEPATGPITKVFNICIGYFLAVLLLSQFLPQSWNTAIFSANAFLMMAVIFYAGSVRVFYSGRYYLIFLLGWVPVMFSFLELVAVVAFEPETGSSTLSYKIIREPFYQIAHMLIHFAAMLIRIDALKRQKYQAEIQNEAKSRFLASISHDLRQPLHSMGMFLAHLNDHISSKSGQSVLAKVYALHASMNDSFKKLMDLSRLEAGAVRQNMESIDLNRLIARMRLEFEPYAYEKGLKIRFKTTLDNIYSDPLLIERIMRNLIANAIKYTDQGGVFVGFRARKDHFLIQVWDTGCGISTVDQRMIFDIYRRSEKVSRSHAGMGIGLAIVKHLVELLGGNIDVRSKEQKGTLFQIRLPLSNSFSDASDRRSDSSIKSGLRIILDLTNTQTLNQVSGSLKNWGYLTEDRSTAKGSSPATLIITEINELPTLKSMSELISNYKALYGNVVMTLFRDDIDRELADKLTALNVYILSPSYRPAQLRSLIQYLESFLLKKQS